MEKIKLGTHEMGSLTAALTCGGAIVVSSSALASYAKIESWFPVIITAVWGLGMLWVNLSLCSLYPDKTFAEIIFVVFGKWLGRLIVGGFVYFCFLMTSQNIWYIGNMMVTQYFTETPFAAVDLLFVIAMTVGLLYGIEAIARASNIFIVFISVVLLLAMVLVIPNIHPRNFTPVFEEGLLPSLKGALLLSSYTVSPLVLLNMIFAANVSDIKKAKKSMVKGYLWAMFLIIVPSVITIGVLGPDITSKSLYPTFLLAKEINVGIIFSRLEALITSVWIISNFTTDILFFYAGYVALVQLIGIKNAKRLVLPLGLFVLVFSDIVYPDINYQMEWDVYTCIPYLITMGILLPISVLVLGKIKKLRKKGAGAKTPKG